MATVRNPIYMAVVACCCLSTPGWTQIREPGTADQQTGSESNSIAAVIQARRTDLQTDRRDDNLPPEKWPGSFTVQDSDTRIRTGGFLQLDIIHDSDAIQSKGQFITDAIPTGGGSKADGADGQTNFSISPSRLYVETRTPFDSRRLKTYISIDMFNDELGVTAEPRLRQAYAELSDGLLGGDLLIGQAWSTTTDLEATPDVLDFRGVDSLFGRLTPQLRWSKAVGDGLKLMLALETPDNHIIEGADSLTRMPDGVLAFTWDSNSFNLMASIIAKDLRASLNNGPVESAIGIGGSISGKIRMPYGSYPDYFMFSGTYGKGIGSSFQNAKADAVFDPVSSGLETLLLFGVSLAYSHSWNARMNSTLTYCCIEIYSDDAQTPDSIEGTEYSSGNLVWHMNSHWLFGIEGIWGKRGDRNRQEASVFRTQITSRVSF